ncbi:MAG TPA: nucleotidyltransferase family protein [Planctomycetota bacterium]|nr:nucleotidyltransferase family protein [Planctomycetota bacterium]
MRALVLAAGMSTRLASVTGGAPKPLTPVAGIPVLHRNLLWLAKTGIKEVFVNLHYRAEEIEASVGTSEKFGVQVTWSHENPILGTAGAAKKLEKELGAEPRFLVVYGDNVFGFDLQKLIATHEASKRSELQLAATIACFDIHRNIHTGIAGGRVTTDAGGWVTGFVEGQPSASGLVNAACYVVESSVLKEIPPPPAATDWGRDVFPKLLQSGLRLKAFTIDGYCLGIDTPEAYKTAQDLFASGRVK